MSTSKTSVRRALCLLAAGFALCMGASSAAADDAKPKTADQIMEAALDGNGSFGVEAGRAQLTLLIEDQRGDRRTRKLAVRSKSLGGAARTVVTLTAQSEVKGQAFLFAENPKAEDDVWMYLPAFGVTRRVEGSQKKGSFLGTHFTFDDLESRDIRESSHERLDDEKIGKTPVYVISSTPKDPSSSSYGKVVSYVRQSDAQSLKVRFFDKDKKTVLKTIFVEKIA
ncbi:MAG: outer membrane lipoprotein-sorting protein, partial [Myxococcota bacterium]